MQGARVILLRLANWTKHSFGPWLTAAVNRLHHNVLATALAKSAVARKLNDSNTRMLIALYNRGVWDQANVTPTPHKQVPWNKGKVTGPIRSTSDHKHIPRRHSMIRQTCDIGFAACGLMTDRDFIIWWYDRWHHPVA